MRAETEQALKQRRERTEAFLTPRVSANQALRLMNANQLTALRTGPSFLFVSNEMPYPVFFYVHEILNHAHAIPGPITLIQVIQAGARKPVTPEAVFDLASHYLLAGLDFADDARFWFEAVVASAAGAWIPIPGICPAETTVHSAGGNQRCFD